MPAPWKAVGLEPSCERLLEIKHLKEETVNCTIGVGAEGSLEEMELEWCSDLRSSAQIGRSRSPQSSQELIHAATNQETQQ